MKSRVVACISFLCCLGLVLGGLPELSAASSCEVKVIELAIAGVVSQSSGDPESQDMIIVKNQNPTTNASVRLVYLQSNGIPAESLSFSLGSVPAGEVRTYVSPALAEMNPTATVSTALALSSDGGSIRIEKSSGGAYCDMVGWGKAGTYEGQAAPAPAPGQTLFRLSEDDYLIDTENNALDFQILQNLCAAPSFQEIQPFVTDTSGDPVDAWVEILGDADRSGDCTLYSADGGAYLIPTIDLPVSGKTATLNRGVNGSVSVPLQLGEVGGRLWFVWSSAYAAEEPVYLPLNFIEYPVLQHDQTWSLIEGLWRPTYAATPGQENVFQSVPAVLYDSDNSCSSVRINEVLPNPEGDDTDNEWVELQNTTSATVMLNNCQIVFDSNVFGFSAFDGLQPNEIRVFSTFSSSDGTAQVIQLRNSSDVPLMMSWEQQLGQNLSEVVQSFYLYDGDVNDSAPDGQSWSRFDDGWRWTKAVTPNAPNQKELPKQSPVPTEFAARSAGLGSVSGSVSSLPSAGPPLRITELLPDPASPARDDTDEYVEVFNPNSVPVDMTGYVLQTGSTFNYRYTFPRQTIAPGAFLVITSGATSISLSNTAGQARLLDRAGRVVSQTDAYTKAPEGAAWAFVEGGWKWTGSPTRGTANRYTPVIGPLSAAAKKSAAKKTAAENAAAAGLVKSSSTGGQKDGSATQDEASGPPSVHGLILAVVGFLGVLYAAYEYRSDIANKIHKLRSDRTAWRTARSRPKGR